MALTDLEPILLGQGAGWASDEPPADGHGDGPVARHRGFDATGRRGGRRSVRDHPRRRALPRHHGCRGRGRCGIFSRNPPCTRPRPRARRGREIRQWPRPCGLRASSPKAVARASTERMAQGPAARLGVCPTSHPTG